MSLDPKLGWAPYGVSSYQDRVYVSAKDGVYVFDLEGKYMEHWGSFGEGKNQFQYANGIATDPNNGNVYVADTGNSRIVALTPEGKVRWLLGAPADDPNSSVFGLPKGIAITPSYRMYLVDRQNNRLQIWQLGEDLPKIDPQTITKFG